MKRQHLIWMICGAYGINERDVSIEEDFVNHEVNITIVKSGDKFDKTICKDICDNNMPMIYRYNVIFKQRTNLK